MSGSGSLEDARTRIDEIDTKMHDLLMQRTEIVRDVAAAKASSGATGLSIRPGREADVVRRLLARHKGDLPKAVIFRLWREIITAKAQIQTPFSLLISADMDDRKLRDICRAHYGSNTELNSLPSERAVLDAVIEDPAGKVAVVSLAGDADQPWWLTLADWRGPKTRIEEAVLTIVARLPFYEMNDGSSADQIEAFSLASVPVEQTSDDRTVVVVRGASADRFSGSDISILAEVKQPEQAVLVDVPGFLTAESDIQTLLSVEAPVSVIGTYAVPLASD